MTSNKGTSFGLNTEEIEVLYRIIRDYKEAIPEESEYDSYDDFEEPIDKKVIVSILKKLSKNLSKEGRLKIDKGFLRKKYNTFNNRINEKAYVVIENGYAQLKTVEINYFNMDSAEFTKRKLDIYYKSRKYLIGYCHLRKAIRKFRTSRIEVAKLTEELYKIPKNFDKNKY